MDRYWVGNTGNWNDTAHWASSSGGAGGQSVPTSSDDVHLDASSFSTAGSITANSTPPVCRDLTVAGVHAGVSIIASEDLDVYGSFNNDGTLSSLSVASVLRFRGTGDFTLATNGLDMPQLGVLLGDGASTLTLLTNLSVSYLLVAKGTFDDGDFNVATGGLLSATLTGPVTINFGNGIWLYTGNVSTFDFDTSATLNGTATMKLFVAGTGTAINTVYFKRGLTYGTVNVLGGTVTLFHDGLAGGGDIAITTLTIAPAVREINFTYTPTFTIGTLTAHGGVTGMLFQAAQTFNPGDQSPAQLTVTTRNLQRLAIHDITAGGTQWNAGYRSTDEGGNTNIRFFDAGTLPIYTTSLGSALCRVSPENAFPQFVFGGQDEDGNNALFKKSDSYGFHVWRSAVYQIGCPFDIFKISFPVYPAITGNMQMNVKVYFDNEESSSVSNGIDVTTYPDKGYISLFRPNFTGSLRGQRNFFIELQMVGTDLLTVGMPLNIEIEEYPHI